MKIRCILIAALAWAWTAAFAQRDAKAREVLDRTAEAYSRAGAVSIRFDGTQSGVLNVKGNKFYLRCGGIETWFDGRTQWSYVEQNEEVNVSEPAPEEVQSVNPYALVTMYREGFNYEYAGKTVRNGKQGQEVRLTPETEQELKSVTLCVDAGARPIYIGIELRNGTRQEFLVRSYLTRQNLPDSAFRFDKAKYPRAEVIDLR